MSEIKITTAQRKPPETQTMKLEYGHCAVTKDGTLILRIRVPGSDQEGSMRVLALDGPNAFAVINTPMMDYVRPVVAHLAIEEG